MFSTEQKTVIRAFEQGFSDKKDQKIILYGVGINTKAVLEETSGFSFAGLMDAASEGQVKYGLPVYSATEVSQMQAKPLIAIIARQSVVNIVYKRIAWLYDENGIEIYDFQGRMLGADELKYNNEELPYWNCSEVQLKQLIDVHDIITFDIFDTLLMRRVLVPTDVFELVERKLCQAGIDIPFKRLRMDAEKKLNAGGKYPEINEIYDEFERSFQSEQTVRNADVNLEEIKRMEIETDRQMLLIRQRMVDIFQYALQAGKKIYLLSDMYYCTEYLKQLLESFGICGYEELWVSCDQKCVKADGSMYHVFAQHLVSDGVLEDCSPESTHRILHIGDNRYSDYEKAIGAGCDAFLIYSANELFQASSIQGILASADTLEKRVVLGTLFARAGNDPFVFQKSRGWFRVENEWDIGYYFVAPIILEFTKWFSRVAEETGVDKILFPSRDGYLIQKVYQYLMQENAVPSVYFRTSRRAMTVASIKNADDIQNIAKRTYQGTCDAFLQARYGVKMDREDSRSDRDIQNLSQEELQKLLNDYEAEILSNASEERAHYLAYLKKLGICSSDEMLIFDFVAGGTVQYAMEQLLGTKLHGVYFATMNLPNSKYELDTDAIRAAYGNIESYKVDTNLGRHYLLLETVLVDGKDTLSHIDEDLYPVYEQSAGRTNVQNMMHLQQGVLQYVKDYLAFFDGLGVDLLFADEIYGLLFSDGCVVPDVVKKIFENDDYYDGQGMCGVFGS